MEKRYVPIVRKGEACKVYLETILLIEQELRRILIHTEEGIQTIYGRLEDMMKYLDGNFLQCHRSCIINMEKVIRMKEQTIYFANGNAMMIGREKFQTARQHYANYILSARERRY